MGEKTIFECESCGFTTGEVRWGVSVMDPRIRFLPALCHTCRDIIEVELTGRDVLVEVFTCPACQTAISFFSRADSFLCPRCGAPDMVLRQQGYW